MPDKGSLFCLMIKKSILTLIYYFQIFIDFKCLIEQTSIIFTQQNEKRIWILQLKQTI